MLRYYFFHNLNISLHCFMSLISSFKGCSSACNTDFNVLVFIRDGGAYTYLIYMVLLGHITIGDFALYFAQLQGWGTGLPN